MTELAKKRPEFRNINAFKDLTTYRMTPAAWVSILHRGSGLIMFLLLPFIISMPGIAAKTIMAGPFRSVRVRCLHRRPASPVDGCEPQRSQ